MKWFSGLLLRILGWKVVVDIPIDLKKFIVVVAPHTSWKDFPLGLVVRASLGRHIYYLGKKELFDSPFGFFFWWTGGRPVDRSHPSGLVDEVAKLFAGHEEFAIALAPEGTRQKVQNFKTGFYYMARRAGVPIIPCLFDFEHKTVHFLNPFYPGEDAATDLDTLWNYFQGVKGANPALGISGRRQAE